MSDVRLVSGLHNVDAVFSAGTEALGAFVVLLSYAAHQKLRDGVIPMGALRWVDHPQAARKALEASGLAAFDDAADKITLLKRGEVWEFHETSRVPAAVRRRVIDRDKRCRYCGAENDLTVDHVKPRARGGSNGAANLVTACRACNAAKNNRTPDEWTDGETAKRGLR